MQGPHRGRAWQSMKHLSRCRCPGLCWSCCSHGCVASNSVFIRRVLGDGRALSPETQASKRKLGFKLHQGTLARVPGLPIWSPAPEQTESPSKGSPRPPGWQGPKRRAPERGRPTRSAASEFGGRLGPVFTIGEVQAAGWSGLLNTRLRSLHAFLAFDGFCLARLGVSSLSVGRASAELLGL